MTLRRATIIQVRHCDS